MLTFLDQAQEHLAALPLAPALRDATVQGEGLRQRPAGLQGESAAAALRGVLLATQLVLALAGGGGNRVDWKRLYWNCRTFRTGRRRHQTPSGMLGINLPTTEWWELLRLTLEQLRQQLSAPGGAA